MGVSSAGQVRSARRLTVRERRLDSIRKRVKMGRSFRGWSLFSPNHSKTGLYYRLDVVLFPVMPARRMAAILNRVRFNR